MDIRFHDFYCLGCGKALLLEWADKERDKDVFEAKCSECKALYRLRVATYRLATQ